MAGTLIGKSYQAWQESPIATSITTHPIDDLDFPVVTVCPPKDSNTALYHDLTKVGNGSLPDNQRRALKESAFEIFMQSKHSNYVRMMKTWMRYLDQIYQGFYSVPKPYKHANSLEIKMWNKNGTISTPWYGEDFVEAYYEEDRDIHMVLELPDDIKEQVGSGLLVIELEVDTREEREWTEQVSYRVGNASEPGITWQHFYTLHTMPLTWTEAEAECQRRGGHLASMTSEEEDTEMFRIIASDEFFHSDEFWLGGRKKLGEWSWSDNSTWGYNKWRDEEKDHGESGCISYDSYNEIWLQMTCWEENQFICQEENRALRGKKTVKLEFVKEQLSFSSFHVWHMYKATSQQLLDSWTKKKMTGLKLSWRIENENPPLTATTDEVGRSFETPGLGDTFAKSALICKAVLKTPEDVLDQQGNKTLVIELDVDMRKEDGWSGEVVYWFGKDYKLHEEKKSWAEAETHCKSKGGQLASIHSREEQTLAETVADGNKTWLGGQRQVGKKWHWSDQSLWSFSNWEYGAGTSSTNGRCLRMQSSGEWYDELGWPERYFLCQGEKVAILENGLTRFQLKMEQLAFFPFYVQLKSQAVSRQRTNSSLVEARTPDFKLNWFLADNNGSRLTKELPSRAEEWKPEVPTPKYEHPILVEMVQLARQLRMHNMTRDQILDKVIREKMVNISILEEEETCWLEQIYSESLTEVFSKLVPLVDKEEMEEPVTEEDVRTGFDIFHAIMYCPSPIVIKLFRFLDGLVSTETSRTIIQSSVNLFRSGVLNDTTSFELAKDFHFFLASSLDLQYGSVLLATSKKAQLQEVLDNNWPFFTNNTKLVETCLNESHCNQIVEDSVQKLGIHADCRYFDKLNCCRR